MQNTTRNEFSTWNIEINFESLEIWKPIPLWLSKVWHWFEESGVDETDFKLVFKFLKAFDQYIS